MTEQYVEVLKNTKLFGGMREEELGDMLKCLDSAIRKYEKDEYIALAGRELDSIGIIVTGSAAVVKEDADGNRIIMALLKPGDLFGEMAVFSKRPVWPANVLAQDKCTVRFIPSSRIVSVCNNACRWHTILIQNLLGIISEKALLLNRKVEYLTIKSMRGRICAFLLEQYKRTGETTINLTMNRNELADFLNVSRPSMSRELCRMRDEGVIDFYRETIRILDVGALKA